MKNLFSRRDQRKESNVSMFRSLKTKRISAEGNQQQHNRKRHLAGSNLFHWKAKGSRVPERGQAPECKGTFPSGKWEVIWLNPQINSYFYSLDIEVS